MHYRFRLVLLITFPEPNRFCPSACADPISSTPISKLTFKGGSLLLPVIHFESRKEKFVSVFQIHLNNRRARERKKKPFRKWFHFFDDKATFSKTLSNIRHTGISETAFFKKRLILFFHFEKLHFTGVRNGYFTSIYHSFIFGANRIFFFFVRHFGREGPPQRKSEHGAPFFEFKADFELFIPRTARSITFKIYDNLSGRNILEGIVNK